MQIAEIIDLAKATAGIESDSAFSKYLGLSRTAVGNWRSGVSLPDTVSCERLAGLTGLPLAKVLGLVGEARAHSREEKAVWRKLAATAAMALCAVGFAIGSAGKPQQVHAVGEVNSEIGKDAMRIWRRYRTDLIHAFGAAFIVGVIFSVCVYALALASTVTGEGIR